MTRAYLQHGGALGPFRTEAVDHYREAGGVYRIRFNASWRATKGTAPRRYIVDDDGTRIRVTIDHE